MRRLVEPRKGQAIVIFPLMIFLVVAMAMMAVNYSYLSQQRMELQITADASARTGAFVQAECLTGIANLNYIVVVLNPIIVILDALSAIPFLAFLKTISEFLSMLITSIINPAQNVIKTAAPIASLGAVLGQGLVNDTDTWSIMLPDKRIFQGNFLCVQPTNVFLVTFGYTGNVMVRKTVDPTDDDGNVIPGATPASDSTIIEGVGVFSFKPKVTAPIPNLPSMLGGSGNDKNLFMYTISAAKPYYVKSDPRSGTLDFYNKNKAMGIWLWAPINPWDARLVSWDMFMKEAVTGSPDQNNDPNSTLASLLPASIRNKLPASLIAKLSALPFGKIMVVINSIKTGGATISGIFKDIFG